MLSCKSFPVTEDRATLRSDPSAVTGSRRQCMMRCLFHCLPGNQSVKPRGPGQRPGKSGLLRRRIAADKRPSDSIGNTLSERASPDPTGNDRCCNNPSNRQQQQRPARMSHNRQQAVLFRPSYARRSSPRWVYTPPKK